MLLLQKVPGQAKWMCRQCGFNSHLQRSVKRHIENIHLKLKFMCHFCEKDFPREDRRREHYTAAHGLTLPRSAIREMALEAGLER